MLPYEFYFPFRALGNIKKLVLEYKHVHVDKIGMMLLHDLIQTDTVYPVTLFGIYCFHDFLLEIAHVFCMP